MKPRWCKLRLGQSIQLTIVAEAREDLTLFYRLARELIEHDEKAQKEDPSAS